MRIKFFSGILAVLSCVATGWSAAPPHPGMLNYVEGQVSINGAPVTAKSVGNVDVEQGQVVQTGKGKAEILLSPGVFVRLGNDTAVKMLNPSLADTSVELVHGEAMVEATSVQKANNIQIVNQGSTTTIDKNGLYAFRSEAPQIQVYDGKATVQQGATREDVKKGKQVALGDSREQKFDTKQGDELYRWSDLRSSYISDASVDSARALVVNNYGWGGGWYWNSGFGFYSYLPGDGFLDSPFGWGYYSPFYVRYYGGPYRYYGGRNGYHGFIGSERGRGFNGGGGARGSFGGQSGMHSAGGGGMHSAGGGGMHSAGGGGGHGGGGGGHR
jgi:hypothetical protein